MNKIFKIILATFVIYSHSLYANYDFKDLTIVVSSCDKYEPLWQPFFASLFQNWDSLLSNNQNIPIILITNNKSFASSRVTTHKNPNDKSWSDNLLATLSKIETKYVLLSLEDYWLNSPVDEKKLAIIYSAMQTENISMVHLSYIDKNYHSGTRHAEVEDMFYTDKFARYKASLQMAIWDVDTLKCLLKPGESPWDFELAGTVRSHGYPGKFCNIETNYPISYINATHQGHVEQFAIDYAVANDLGFEQGKLPVMHNNSLQNLYSNLSSKSNKLLDFVKHPTTFCKAYSD